jgi:hypothetical protein
MHKVYQAAFGSLYFELQRIDQAESMHPMPGLLLVGARRCGRGRAAGSNHLITSLEAAR